jgi:hypothetical protein
MQCSGILPTFREKVLPPAPCLHLITQLTNESFTIPTCRQIFLERLNQEERGKACSMHKREMHTKVLKERDNEDHVEVDGVIILKLVLHK